MVKLVNESAIFAHEDFKDWNWLFFNNKESDCILYSEDGHEFRIHKEILSQTKKMRNILSNSKDGCCGAMQIICPCSKDVLEYMVKFLYTGTIFYKKKMDLSKILDNLTEIFGFPKNLFSEEDCYKALILDEASDFETIEELEIADEYHKMYPTETYDYDYNSEAPGYGGYYNGNYNGSYTGYAKNINIFLNFVNVESTDIGDIMQRIIAALREREIGIFRLNNIPKPTAAPVPSGSLSNIFGTGENFVKLESPDINYFFYF